jgi:hypothetical protein
MCSIQEIRVEEMPCPEDAVKGMLKKVPPFVIKAMAAAA